MSTRKDCIRKLLLVAVPAFEVLLACHHGALGAAAPGVQASVGPATVKVAAGIPVRFVLESAGYQTVVIDDSQGNRVRNLIAETWLPAGENSLVWDGYDDGMRDQAGSLVRHRVAAGTYHVRGLSHQGIGMRYELTVDNAGTPPWATKDGSGGWLADHSSPADILCLPEGIRTPNGKGPARFLVCSTSGEAGSEFVWLDDEGRRLYGTNDGFWGGTHLARDTGAKPEAKYYAYVFESGQRDADNFTIEVRGFRTDNGQLESVIKYPRPRTLRTFRGHEPYGSDGLAVHNGRIVLAITMLNKLVFVDAGKKKILGEATVASPISPAFDLQGRLYILSEGKLKRFILAANSVGLEEETTLVDHGLDDPHRLRLDEQGNLFVSDWGRAHQVRIFDPEGKPLRGVGKTGGPQLGIYDESRMAYPCGMAVDKQGCLWVAEGDVPKRISVWKADGSFIKTLYGPEKYGGGGSLDPRDKTRFYYEDNGNCVEFEIDWARATSKVKSVYYRQNMMTEMEAFATWSGPERAYYRGDHQYMVNCFNGNLRYNQDRGAGIWLMDSKRVARPVVIIANAADMLNGIWGWRFKNHEAIVDLWKGHKPEDVLFVWCDRNGDGVAQPEEIQWIVEDHSASPHHDIGGIGLEPLVHPDLSFTTAYGTYLPPPVIDSRGMPVYDLNKRTIVGDRQELRSPLIVGDRIVTRQDSDGSWIGFDLEVKKRWRYPATPEEQIAGPGLMVAPTRLLGPAVFPNAGQAGSLVAVNGEMGAIYLLTTDGLFLQTLGGDARLLPPFSEPNPQRGWLVPSLSFQQEHFHPTINQVADGSIYLVAGFQQGTILRLEGLESVRRRDYGSLVVTPAQLVGLPAAPVQAPRKQGRPTFKVPILARAPRLDDGLSDWPEQADWMRIDDRASAAIAVDHENLYVAYRTGEAALLDNAGQDFRYLFKTGGALDLMLGTNPQAPRNRASPASGDQRLLVTRVRGQTRAVLYRPIAPEAPREANAVFESPIGKIAFDEVRDVSDKLQLKQAAGNYLVSVPLKLLGLKFSASSQVFGDVGVLRGAEGRTMQRAYWSNPQTTIVSDIPSEAQLYPERWGVWSFR